MKKNIKLFILVIVCLFIVNVDSIAAISVNYYGCNNIEGGSNTQSFSVQEDNPTFKCLDEGFVGWTVVFMAPPVLIEERETICLDGPASSIAGSPPNCKKGYVLYENGIKLSNIRNFDDNVGISLNAVTAKFDPGTDDVSGTMSSNDVSIDNSQIKLAENKYKREGYSFAGWYYKVSGGDYMCQDRTFDSTCAYHGGRKVFSDQAYIAPTYSAYSGGVITFVATWKSGNEVEEPAIPCENYKNKSECENSDCSWNNTHNFCSVNGLAYLSCGDAEDIPDMVPTLVSKGVTTLKTVVPIVLIIMSIIQLVKAITSGKEDDIKKAQTGLIKKVVVAILVFFVITIVQFIMLKVADGTERESLSNCLSCFLNGTDDCGSIYYKDSNGEHINVK